MNPLDWLRRRSDGFWVAALILATLLAGAGLALTVSLNEDLRKWLIKYESGSTTIRNIGLLIAGIIAIGLAVWRSRVAERQAAIAQQQAEIAQNQAATAERGLLNERYQRGTEMLGSDVLSVRLGGIHSLQRLAVEHAEEYHVQTMKSFCSFARNPTADKSIPFEPNAKVREDVQTVMNAIGTRNEYHVDLEEKSEYRLDLSGVKLRGANLNLMNLQLVVLTHSDLTNSFWIGTNFEGALFMRTNLSGAFFPSAKIAGADFSGDGNFPAMNLTQSQLDRAHFDPNNPPLLKGVVDAEGEPLVWRRRPVIDDKYMVL